MKKMKAQFDTMGNRVLSKLERQMLKAGHEPAEANSRNGDESDGQSPEDYMTELNDACDQYYKESMNHRKEALENMKDVVAVMMKNSRKDAETQTEGNEAIYSVRQSYISDPAANMDSYAADSVASAASLVQPTIFKPLSPGMKKLKEIQNNLN